MIEFRQSYELAQALAVALYKEKGFDEADTRIVTAEENDKPFAELKIKFVKGEPQSVTMNFEGTSTTDEWKGEETFTMLDKLLHHMEFMLGCDFVWLATSTAEE